MVGIDLGENLGNAKGFQEKHHLTFPVLIDPDKTSSPKFKKGYAIPTNVVVDGNMVVRYCDSGFDSKELDRTIAKLLAEPQKEKSSDTRSTAKKL